MDSRTLLQIINKGEKAKQFWEKFLGKDILDELLKYPELLSMQDAKRAKVTKEEKEFFVKCIFSFHLTLHALCLLHQVIHVAGHTHAARKTASLCHFIASFLFVTLLLCPYE